MDLAQNSALAGADIDFSCRAESLGDRNPNCGEAPSLRAKDEKGQERVQLRSRKSASHFESRIARSGKSFSQVFKASSVRAEEETHANPLSSRRFFGAIGQRAVTFVIEKEAKENAAMEVEAEKKDGPASSRGEHSLAKGDTHHQSEPGDENEKLKANKSLATSPTTPSRDPPMTRVSEVSEFGADEVPEVKVLAKSKVKSSASFPITMEGVGPHKFRRLKLLGKGGAGTVYLVNLRGTPNVYAMKVLTKEDMIQRNKVLRVMTEREILATANHPFIVTMYATFQTSDSLCFVMDFCGGGEFFNVLSRQPQKRLQEHAAQFYAAEILLALEYLHYLGFLYRDLKPENILMRDSGHIALTDFDLSKQAHAVSPRMIEHHKTIVEKLSGLMTGQMSSKISGFEVVDSEPVLEEDSTSFVGTLEYLAPELVKGERQNSAVDWWTFGILIYEMMSGTTPFRAKTSEEVLANITNTHEKIVWDHDVGSVEARKMVRKLLKRDPKKRLGSEHGATEIKKSGWFSNVNFSLIRNEVPPIIPSNVPDLQDFEGVDLVRDEARKKAENKGDDDDDSDDEEEGAGEASKSNAFAAFDMQRKAEDLHQY